MQGAIIYQTVAFLLATFVLRGLWFVKDESYVAAGQAKCFIFSQSLLSFMLELLF